MIKLKGANPSVFDLANDYIQRSRKRDFMLCPAAFFIKIAVYRPGFPVDMMSPKNKRQSPCYTCQ